MQLELNRAYSFLYPRHNFHGVLSQQESRKIVVEEIRDVTTHHLDDRTVEIQPLLRRGRWLITGIDLDKKAERSFYLESMQRVKLIE